MARAERPLSEADRHEAFRIATKSLLSWYADEIASGMTDEELAEAQARVLGIFGGSCGPDRLDVCFQGAGLKIWAGWHIVNHIVEPPIFRGRQTIAMARVLYGIEDPQNPQLSLW